MARRSTAAKRSKTGSHRRAGGRAAVSPCRAWRPEAGPPSYVVQRQLDLQLKFAGQRRAATEQAALPVVVAQNVLPFEKPTTVLTNARPNDGLVVAELPARPVAGEAAKRTALFTPRGVAAALLLMPSVLAAGLAGFVASRRDAPVAAPDLVAMPRPAPVRGQREVDFAAQLPRLSLPSAAPDVRALPPSDVAVAMMLPQPRLPSDPPVIAPLGEITFATLELPTVAPDVPLPSSRDFVLPAPQFALARSAPLVEALVPPTVAMPTVAMPTVAMIVPDETKPVAVAAAAANAQCVAEPGFTLLPNAKLAVVSLPPADEDAALFGLRLAVAARAQTASLVIYNARYSTIAYPGGDVSPFYGVCTDVIVRAYRALGIDLQIEVAAAKVGTGDRNIDHRRTEVMRKFLARAGESLAVSDDPDNYQPGDIVTYYRPQNKSSTAHIAIVSDVVGPSGQPMIVHNRGWGVQLEDALFVDKITGHYRYAGRKAADPMVAMADRKAPLGAKPLATSAIPDQARIKPKTPGGATMAKAGSPARALP